MNENIVELLYKIKFTNEKKIAVIFNEETVTYQKLYDMSNVFYNHIIQHYMKKEIVCVICKRSIELIACVIGIIRAGKAYFILEPNDINESIISILNAMPKKVIFVETQNHLIDETVLMGGISGDNIANDSYVMRKGGDLLYLTCTSGTTKNERIIMVEDRNLLCYINAYIKQFNMREKDVVLQQSPVYYDGFAEEIFSMLLVGGTIVLTDTANLKSPQKIVEIVKKHSVSILPSTPLMINELNKLEIMPSIRAIISSGDVLKKSYINNLLEWTNVFNMYGLTETTVCATCYMCSERDDEIIPIGKEIEGYHLELRNMIRSEESNLEIGEIYILGQGVARGYWNIEENVVIKFMENGEQLYKTGDFAWKDRNGILHYVGRKDRQIKIRGNKVNLSHIEEIIYEMNNIDNVVALDCGKMQNICVFFISNQHTIDDIRAFCQRRLDMDYTHIKDYLKEKIEEIEDGNTVFIRAMERGTISEGRNEDGSDKLADMELVRIAIPRRVYSLSHVKYAIDRLKWLFDNRELIQGLEFVEEPEKLRFYFGKLQPVSDWQIKLVGKYKMDFGESL